MSSDPDEAHLYAERLQERNLPVGANKVKHRAGNAMAERVRGILRQDWLEPSVATHGGLARTQMMDACVSLSGICAHRIQLA